MSTVLTVAGGAAGPRRPEGPPVRLFGQFLVDQGAITSEDLGEALDLMNAINVTVGDLAVERGLISRHDADEIHRLQRCIDGRWGEIALTLGVGRLSPAMLEELRWQQESQNLRLTDALVQLGCLCPTEIDRYLEEFEALYRSNPATTLPGSWRLSCAQYLLDVLPRVFLRVLRSPLRFGPIKEWDQQDLGTRGSVRIETEHEALIVGLSVEGSVAELIGQRLQQDRGKAGPEQHVVAFIELLLEHVCRRLESDSQDRVVTLPAEPGRLPPSGLACELASSSGQAVLVLHRISRWGD